MEKTHKYYQKMFALGFAELEPIPDDELEEILKKVDGGEKLPPNICFVGNAYGAKPYMRYVEKYPSEEDFKKVCMLMMLEKTNTIKNEVLFFAVLSVISIVLSLVSLVSFLQ